MTRPVAGGGAPSAPRDIACETAVRRLWDYLDGRLPPAARAEVEAHLATCSLCPPHFAFAGAMQRALATWPPPLEDGADERLRHRVRAALDRLVLDAPADLAPSPRRPLGR